MALKTVGQKFSKFCPLIPLSITLSGIAVLFYQGFYWVIRGNWKPLCSKVVLDIILPTNFIQWLENLSSGLMKKIISSFFNFPLSLFLLIFGVLVVLLVFTVFDLLSKHKKSHPHFQENMNPVLKNQYYTGLLDILSSQNGHNSIVTVYILRHTFINNSDNKIEFPINITYHSL